AAPATALPLRDLRSPRPRARSESERSPAAALADPARLPLLDRARARDLCGVDGHPAPGRARPDDRGDGAAEGRLRAGWDLAVLLGLHRLHARLHRHRPALREAR